MPILKVPSLKQAESKIRLCRNFLKAYEVERYELQELHRSGELSKPELEELLKGLDADTERIQKDLESTRIIHRQNTAA